MQKKTNAAPAAPTKIPESIHLQTDSLMAVQEKLGLFAAQQEKANAPANTYLTKKPLGLI